MPKSTSAAKVIPFEYKSTNIRTLKDEDGTPLFVAQDVCEILGYSNPARTVRDHCREKGIRKRYTLTSKGQQEVVCIDEGNLYRLIIKSNKPESEPFEAWVCDEVLPTIRKTGTYTLNTLTPAQQREIQRLVSEKAMSGVPKGEKPKRDAFMWIYRSIKDHFQVAKYSQVPESKFNELVQFLGGSIPRGKKEALPTPQPQPGLSDEDRQEVWDNLVISCREIEDFFGYIHAHIPKMLMALSRMSNSESILFTDLMVKHKVEWNQQRKGVA